MHTLKTLIFIVLLCLGSRVQAQYKVTINLRNTTVGEVFEEITRQTSVLFHFTEKETRNAKKLSLNFKNTDLDEVLRFIANNQPFTCTREKDAVTLALRDSTPQNSIKGTIIDDQNDYVAGATIKGENNEIDVSDNKGKFELHKQSANARLVYSGINIYTDSILLQGRTRPYIYAKLSSTDMEPVNVSVNLGLQSTSIKNITGETFILNNNTFNRRPSYSMLDRLRGIVPGFLPVANKIVGINQADYFTLTPPNTILGNRNPMIVLDEIIYEGDPNMINPNDIDSIVVLQGAPGTAIWGSRAANGVVLITTKKGKPGNPFNISFNNSYSISNRPNLFYEERMDADDMITFNKELGKQGYYNFIGGPTPAISPAGEAWLKRDTSNYPLWRKQDVRRDMSKYFYRNATERHTWLGISGGTKSTAFYLSGGYDSNSPEVQGSRLERKTINTNNRLQLTRKLQLTIAGSLTHIQEHNTGALPAIPAIYERLVDDNGKALNWPLRYKSFFTDTAGKGRLLNWKYSPYNEFQLRDQTLTNMNKRVLFGLKYRILKDLELNALAQYQWVTTTFTDRKKKETFYVRDLVNKFTPQNAGTAESAIPWGDIIDESQPIAQTANYRLRFNYSKRFKRNSINLVAGHDLLIQKGKGSNSRLYGVDDVHPYGQTNLDYKTRIQMYDKIDIAQTIYTPAQPGNTFKTYTAYYFSGVYTQGKKYVFSGSLRVDKSNLFGWNTRNDGHIWLPSVGMNWNLHEERFYPFGFMETCKLRLSYGFSGNTSEKETPLQNISLGGVNANNDTYYRILSAARPNLRWELVKTLNIGMTATFLHNRLDASIDLCSRHAQYLLGYKSTDPTTGNNYVYANVNAMKTMNTDIALHSDIIQGDFSWQAWALLTFSTNKVVATFDSTKPAWQYTDAQRLTTIKGRPLNGINSFRYASLNDKGDPLLFYRNDKSSDYHEITNAMGTDALTFSGPSTPRIYGSLRNDFSYKQWLLSILLGWKLQYFFRANATNYYNVANEYAWGASDFKNRYKAPGDEKITKVPGIPTAPNSDRDVAYTNSDITVQKADHIRVSDISLSYTMQQQALNRLHMKAACFYVTMSNVGILWRANDRKIDPDQLTGYPALTTFTIGFRGNF